MAEPTCSESDLLSALNSRENLFAFLRNKLSWVIDPEDTFTFLDDEAIGRAKSRADLSQIIPFSGGDPFVIFLVEFHEKFRRGDLREILRGVRKRIKEEAAYRSADLDEMVFVCMVPEGLRFVQFEERSNRQPRLRMFGFDSETVGETYTLRNVNLPLLRLRTNLLGEVDWSACRKDWQDAWNVEKVTKQFFKDYRDIFFDVEKHHVHNAPGDKRLFVQRFFNRLMFLHFLAKKEWLRAPGKTAKDNVREYLGDLWQVYQRRDKRAFTSSDNFYRLHLSYLFFAALNQPHVSRNNEVLLPLVGDVPYLNGGLFEQTEDDKRTDFTIDDEAFTKIWDGLFSCYNFTVSESTPDDQDVAVDPEMLGKVFEELVTGRHESGSYYTPRPVVQFMCREALKGYLAPCGAGIEKFVDFHDAADITNHEAVLTALRSVKAVDPACGSGAYLLGLLQELMALRMVLFNAKKLDDASRYTRKLEIIQNSIYGVDLDPFAVNTARLRLWLSLVVEDTRKPLADPNVSVALPNLDFKIEQGNSLLAPDPSGVENTLNAEAYRSEGNRLRVLYSEFFNSKNGNRPKEEIRAEIIECRKVIAELFGDDVMPEAYDWRVDCAHIFAAEEPIVDIGGALNLGGTLVSIPEAGGFDIVLANPPYVRADAQFKHLLPDEKARQAAINQWKEFRVRLKKSEIYTTLYEKWDLYIPFLERAFQMLKKNGSMIFIIPDAVNVSKYATKSRAFFLANSKIVRLDFCTDVDLFDAGVTNTILHFAKAKPKPTDTPIRVRRYAPDRNEFAKFSEVLASMPQLVFGETLFKQSGEKNEGAAEGTVPLETIFYISKGMVIHADERDHLGEFVAEDVLLAKPDKTHSRRFVFGKDIIRWGVRNERFLEWDTARAPFHFSRPTFPELQQAREKIVTVRTPGAIPKSVYDADSLHFDASSIGFIPWHYLNGVRNKSIKKTAKYNDEMSSEEKQIQVSREELEVLSLEFNIKYVIGVMNSETARFWLAKQRRSRLHIYPDDWKKLPVVAAPSDEQAVIAALVQQCLDRRGQDVAELEAAINAGVAALYGL